MTQHIKTNSHFVNRTLIICAGILVFSPCLFDFFVSDDFIWLSRGVNLSPDDLLPNASEVTYHVFRPLVPALFFVFHQVFGLSASGYHLSGIIVHILNGLLFYSILSRFSLRKDVAVVSAVIFVTHFAHEESVFWISGICVLSCWFFSLSSILAFLKWMKDGKIWIYFLSICLGLFALFLREDAVILPLVLSLITWMRYLQSKRGIDHRLGTRTRSWVTISLLPFFLMLVGYLYLRSVSLPHLRFGALFSLDPTNFIRNLAYFLANITFPTRLAFDAIGYHYSRTINSAVNSIDSNLAMVLASSFVIIFLILVFFTWIKKTNKNFKLLVITFLVTLLPFIFFKDYSLRFTYLPLLGFSPIAAFVLLSLAPKITKRSFWVERRHIWLSLIIIFLNFFVLFERHLWWSKASRTCEEVITSAGAVVSSLPAGSTVCFVNLPSRVHGAYIFNNGFVEAMSLFFPSYHNEIEIIESRNLVFPDEGDLENFFLFKYKDGEFYPAF